MSQCDRVLAVLADGHSHSIREIHARAGTMRLNSRVAELRKRGHMIECHRRIDIATGQTDYHYQLAGSLPEPDLSHLGEKTPGDLRQQRSEHEAGSGSENDTADQEALFV